jgi:hypothetical protein
VPRPTPPAGFKVDPRLLEMGAAPFWLNREIRKEIASALGIIVYPLVDTTAWPASERRKLAAIGKSIMTAEDALEALVGTYRTTCGLARQESGFTKGSIIAALRNLLRSQERLRSAQGRRGLEEEGRRVAAASAYREALLRIVDSRSGLDNETTKQLEKLATRCLAPLRLHPHRVPEAAPELASAVRRRIEELRSLARMLPGQENRDLFLALLRQFFLKSALPNQNDVAPDDRRYHRFVLAVLEGADIHREIVAGYTHNPRRLTEILANLPAIP